jgi:hypothetical protein
VLFFLVCQPDALGMRTRLFLGFSQWRCGPTRKFQFAGAALTSPVNHAQKNISWMKTKTKQKNKTYLHHRGC